jgi:hypothetical protein
MNRRQFALFVPALAASPVFVRASRIPPIEFEAEDFAQVRYASGEEDGIRSLTARVSQWADAAAAEEFRQLVIAGAGSNLPLGEFYQSEPVASPVAADAEDSPATMIGWYTTVGAAGFVTEWVLLAIRRDRLTWDLRISGAEPGPLQELAAAFAEDLPNREPGNDLFSLLPADDEVPEGLELEYTMTFEGTVNAEGTPIPEPTQAPN